MPAFSYTFHALVPACAENKGIQVGIPAGLRPLCLPFKKKMASTIFPSKARVGVPLNAGIMFKKETLNEYK